MNNKNITGFRENRKPDIAVKEPASVEGQLQKLKERGCIVENEQQAVQTLTNINYYRLAYYFSVFLEAKSCYREGTTFCRVVRIYDFDRRLRNLLLEVLEEIEIAMRAYVSNLHAAKYGASGYMNIGSFDFRHNHKAFLQKIERLVEANYDSGMVMHHVKKYGGNFPLWAIMELFSFGMLCVFFEDMKPEDREEIAKDRFGVSTGMLISWLNNLSDLRNHCAHYHRLYGSRLGRVPSKPAFLGENFRMNDMVFDYITVIKAAYCRKNDWSRAFVEPLKKLLSEYGEDVDLKDLGFPPNWEELLTS